MAQVIIDYEEYQKLLEAYTNLAGAKKETVHLESLICRLTKEKALIESQLDTLKAMKEGY